MRWGVRDDATSDHQTVKLCLDEIANCQKVSKGPNFVVRIYYNLKKLECYYKFYRGVNYSFLSCCSHIF